MSNFPSPVPKPATAGTGQTAIANTRQAFVNIRNGPGTQYRDIGDLRNFTLVSHFPASRTGDGWVWIEQYGIGGWVSTSVVNFENVSAKPPITSQATPYDNKVAVWHWRGDSVGENSIEEIAQTIKTYAPHVTQVWVKTSDYTPQAGAQWMGYWDTKRSVAIDGPSSIDRWVQVLTQYGLEFHAWCVPRGLDVNAETNLIIQACLRPGVKSMILDVEPYAGFWSGGQAGIRPFMTRIRKAIPGAFHIGLSVDPRSHHFASIFPQEWAPFVNSVHPQVYWETMRREAEDVLEETYRVWGSYGKPIIPALQGDADASSIEAAQTLATQRHSARGVSWWRFGVIGPVEWRAVNRPIQPGTTPPPPPPTIVYGEEQVIKPGDSGYNTFSFTGQNDLQTFAGTWGWDVYYKGTESQISKAAVRWSARLTDSGKYEVAAFVPARHATTQNARYKIHGVRGSSTEVLVTIDQAVHSNKWVSLGVFDFDVGAMNSGTVFLNDLTGETGKEIAFDAMRWRKVIEVPGTGMPVEPGYADGYDPPIGTAAERRSDAVWPGQWLDASPFGRLYFVGTASEAYHTGADLNLPRDADAHTPVYSAASGVVTFAARLPTWGNVIIIKHDPLPGSGLVMYGRYAHVENVAVSVGQRVSRGTQIANVGNAYGRYAYHLHFDLSPTNILELNPPHWPKKDRDALFRNYVDPREFIASNRPR
jgi:murein DD-endopeptidase MepM/ murein hydrolase activator NlpD